MATPAQEMQRAKNTRAALDAATTIGKLPKKPSSEFKAGDVVKFHNAVGEQYRQVAVGEGDEAQTLDLTWLVYRISAKELGTTAIHVRPQNIVVDGNERQVRFGRTLHFAARPESLIMVQAKADANEADAE